MTARTCKAYAGRVTLEKVPKKAVGGIQNHVTTNDGYGRGISKVYDF